MSKHTIEELQQKQMLPLNAKVRMTQMRIQQWVMTYGLDGVYVSFSGGKDSTVLLDIARKMYPEIKAAFVDTGLEYPEIRDFVKTFDNVDWLKPKMNFRDVIQKYGYPFISKEVSESVSGARKYLTALIENGTLDRQTDRQTDRQDSVSVLLQQGNGSGSISEKVERAHIESIRGGGTTYTNTNVTDYLERADEKSKNEFSRGGYDNKYRKLRGIGEYSKRQNEIKVWRCEPEIGNHDGDADKRQGSSDKGEYP